MDPTLIITTAIGAIVELMKFVAQARAQMQRDGEWTPELEAEFDAKVRNAKNSPQWQIEPPPS